MTKTFFAIIAGVALGATVLSVNYYATSPEPATDTLATASDERIAQLQARVEDQPNDPTAYTSLARAYLEAIRQTGDVTLYRKTADVLDEAAKLETEPTVDRLELQALLASGLHDFTGARELIEEAIAMNSQQARLHGIDGDIHLEQGNYEAAVNAYQRMIDLKPNFNSYSRIAHMRALYGDTSGAIEAYQRALASGATDATDTAWAHVQIGNTLLRTDPQAADTAYSNALAIAPNYASAIAGRAQAAHYTGAHAEAVALAQSAYAAFPTAEHAILLGDLFSLNGDSSASNQYYALAEVALLASQDSGINIDAGYAEFLVVRDRKPDVALTRASRAYEATKSIRAIDIYATALSHAGRLAEAEAVFLGGATLPIAEYDTSFWLHRSQNSTRLGEIAVANQYLQNALTTDTYLSVPAFAKLTELTATRAI